MTTSAWSMDQILSEVESLAATDPRRHATDEIERRLKALCLGAAYEPMALEGDPIHIWHRGRLCEGPQGYSNLSDCLYPPPHQTRLGRANLANRPVLYASQNEMTVFSELAIEKGEFVQVTAVRCHRPYLLSPIGEIAHILQTGRSRLPYPAFERLIASSIDSQSEALQKRMLVDSFLGDEFSRPAEHAHNYKLTAAYANMLCQGPNVALHFPSVQVKACRNIAVPARTFDENFEVLYTQVFEVHQYLRYGLYTMIQRNFANVFDADGTIRWDNRSGPLLKWSLRGGIEVPDGYVGWRPNTSAPRP